MGGRVVPLGYLPQFGRDRHWFQPWRKPRRPGIRVWSRSSVQRRDIPLVKLSIPRQELAHVQ